MKHVYLPNPTSRVFIPVLALLLLLSSFSIASAQTVTRDVRLNSLSNLFPNHVGGDRDFGGNGPNVYSIVSLRISTDKKKLEAVVYFHAKETKSDWTEAKGNWVKTVATAPSGYQFTRILSKTSSWIRYIDKSHSLDYPRIQGGNLVRSIQILGDTGGSDVGNTTSGDTHIKRIYFNTARVQMRSTSSGSGRTTIAQSSWLNQLRRTFGNTRIRLNNYTPKRFQYNRTEEFAYHKPNDSYICTIYNGRTYKYPINIPVQRKEPVSIYVTDMNTERISASRHADQLKLTLYFESVGHEMWTNCIANAGCFAIGNRSVQMNTAKVDILLRPKVERGKLSYDCTKVELLSTTRIDGCHDDAFAFLCDIFMPNRQSLIKSRVESSLKSQLNNRAHKAIISEILRRNLNVNGNITRANIDYRTGNLIIVP